jgi:hypothetical protein
MYSEAVFPFGVTISTELTQYGTVSVVVPPDGVKTDETTVDGAIAMVSVDPDGVTTVTELGVETTLDGMLYESGAGTELTSTV